MPTYDYYCANCGWHTEICVSIDDREKLCEEACPECGELKVSREYGAPLVNLSFRGSTISSKADGFMKERLTEIKKQYGKDKCKGIDL